MGDRIAFGFKATEDAPVIWLYSHWGGSSRYADLAKAIEHARPRWDDPSYATRMAICNIIGKEQFDAETGFGIELGDASRMDLNYDEVLVVHWYNKTVTHQSAASGEVYVDYGFEVFLKIAPRSWPPVGVS